MTDRLTLDDVAAALEEMFAAHRDCRWRQVSGCVYCADHDVRLYRGSLPAEKVDTPARSCSCPLIYEGLICTNRRAHTPDCRREGAR